MHPTAPAGPWLGIDISKDTFDACLLLPCGARRAARLSNDRAGFGKLDAWLRKHAHTALCIAGLEATGPYSTALLRHLHGCGHTVSLLNPRGVKNFGIAAMRRVKTDAADAALIAEMLKALPQRAWTPLPPAVLELQELVRRRADLLDMGTAESNRAKASQSAAVRNSLQVVIGHLKEQVAQLNRAIDALVLHDAGLQKSVRLLTSIPGIGRVVAVTILAEIPVIRSFERARDAAAFAGLTPALCQSGTSVRRRGAICKTGSALLRRSLYMAALQSARYPSNAFHAHYKAFVERGKNKMVTLVAIMHKLLRVAFGVLKHQTPFAPELAAL